MLAYEESFESSGHLSPSLPPPGCNACPTQLIYTPLHLYSTPRVAKRTTCFAQEHNTMTQPEIAPQTSEAESTPQPLGHLASQEQEEQNNYTKPVCSLDKHRKLLVQSRSKHILHHWSIPRWDLSSTHLKRNWKKKNENKGKERKKEKEWFLSLLSLSRIWFMSYMFCQSWRVVPSEMDSLYYQCH